MAFSPFYPLGEAVSFEITRQWQQRAKLLEYATLTWAAAELFGGLFSGVRATNITLLSFGVQSGIEFGLSTVMLWRLSHQHSEKKHTSEASALRWAGISFFALAILTSIGSVLSLAHRHSPSQTLLGTAVTCAAVVIMPTLALGKRIAAGHLQSAALRTDASQNSFCAYQAAIVLSGLLLYRLFGWWWSDALAALILVPFMVCEGMRALRGQPCGCTASSRLLDTDCCSPAGTGPPAGQTVGG
jgi:divalent metal cation (Fe/Co/Zn/Cd) transporter